MDRRRGSTDTVERHSQELMEETTVFKGEVDTLDDYLKNNAL